MFDIIIPRRKGYLPNLLVGQNNFGNKILILNIFFPGDSVPTTEGVEKENYAEPTFQENAFLARKAKEAERRRTHRLMKTVQHSPLDTTKTNSVRKKDGKHMEKDLRAVARYSQEVKH